MADQEKVPGNGHMFGECSFYGTEQQHQTQLCEKLGSSRLWDSHSESNSVLVMAIRSKAPTAADSAVKLQTSNNDALRFTKTQATPAAYEQIFKTPHVYHKALGQEQAKIPGKRKREPSPEPIVKLEFFNPLQGRLDAWQSGESVDDFVHRLPPLTTSISTCPWIWAENPHRNPRNKSPCPRVEYFTTCGMKLLEQSLENRRKIQHSNAAQLKGGLDKQLSQESKLLQERIANLARETFVLSGKWMLLLDSADVTRVWKQVVAGVIENRLGCSCKVATDDGNDERLVCVYTTDFQDTKDVLRVLQELEKMDLVSADRIVYYKSDAYACLGLTHEKAAENGLQANLYNSRSMLAANQISKSGPVTQKKH